LVFVLTAVVLGAYHHRDLAALTVAPILDKILDLLGHVVADRTIWRQRE